MEKIKIILDTDIGDDIDDAFALTMAVNADEIELLGVTTVFRNSLKRAQLAKRLLRSLSCNVEVYKGIDEPIKQIIDDLIPEHIKKKEEKDKYNKYMPPQCDETLDNEKISDIDAITFMRDQIEKYPNEVVLVGIGPLTNIASLLTNYPEVKQKIRKIVIMGGWATKRDYPEWNIFCDPEAADIVFNSEVLLEAVGLDVTLECSLNEKDLEELNSIKEQTVSLISKLMDMWFEHYEFDTPVMHDPLAITTLFADTVVYEKKNIQVQLDNERGKTFEVSNGNDNNTYVGIRVDTVKFKEIFKKLILKGE